MSPAAAPETTTVCFSFFPQTPVMAGVSVRASEPMNSTTQPAGSPSVTATSLSPMLFRPFKAAAIWAEVES